MLLHKSVEFDSRVRREAGALAAAGHAVFVLELAPVPVDARVLDGFHRVSVLAPPWVRRLTPFHLYRLAFLLSFTREARRLAPDVIHAHDAAMLLPGWAAARLAGVPLIYDSHELATAVPYRERGWACVVGAIERVIVPRCAAVITVSDGIAARLADRYRLTTAPVVIRNVSALRPGGVGGLRTVLGLDRDQPLVLHQGAPAPGRGCEVLVDAAAQLPEDVHLVFLGDPEPGYGRQLAGHVSARGLDVPLERLLAHTAEADVGVTLLQDTCENHRLALPNKLFEYIAAGVPVVAAALAETERLVEAYGVGWCADSADPAAVARALEAALAARGDPLLGERLRRAGEELTWSREQARLTGLYDRLAVASVTPVRPVRPVRPVTPAPAPMVLQLVRNGVTHDARVLRAARAARQAGAEPVVIGVATGVGAAGETRLDGLRVIRFSPPVRGWRAPARRQPPIRPVSRDAPLRSPSAVPTAPLMAAPAPASSPTSPAPTLGLRARLRRRAVGAVFVAQALAQARRLGPEVVHANDWNTMWAGVAIKLGCGAQLVYDSHELWPDRNGRWESRTWLLLSEALFVRVADQVLVTSPGHGQALAARHRTAAPLVVRNIAEPGSKPDSTRGSPDGLASPPVLAYIGGIMPGRGLERAIDALPLLPGLVLCATGPGAEAYRQALTARAAALGVADRLTLCPPVAPDAISAVLSRAVAGLCLIEPVCRSYELCLPNKLFEYVAAGLPVIASDLAVIGPVVAEHGLGAVVSVTDPAALAAAVLALCDPERHRAAVAAVNRFAAANPAAAEQAKLTAVYRRALGVSARRGRRGSSRRPAPARPAGTRRWGRSRRFRPPSPGRD
jgi:glycosyltransferase involved in cell wall biosynthesis